MGYYMKQKVDDLQRKNVNSLSEFLNSKLTTSYKMQKKLTTIVNDKVKKKKFTRGLKRLN